MEKGSKAEDVGLKRGDQILEVNGQSFEHVSHARALEILRGTTHLSITVKSNLLAFKEMLSMPDNSPRSRSRNKMCEIARLQADPRARLASTTNANLELPSSLGVSLPDGIAIPPPPSPPPISLNSPSKKDVTSSAHKGFMTLGPKRRLQKALMKMNILPKNTITYVYIQSINLIISLYVSFFNV